ncbi:protein LMBR1L-like isoform X2 [Anneissia japonica]|uniref:protein LMBR1L-like isoform X2 n=1 Tax=Anneissia japonica TaxID=1529436 RepID=UPI0014256DA4|nr:protein LMBR1L-like isoform X2 [Anneissia japonica]
MAGAEERDWNPSEQVFHDAVRENLIDFLFFAFLYMVSYAIIYKFKRQPDKEDYFSYDVEDAMVYKVSLWICVFTLAVSFGAVLLLPFTIASNEVLLRYPNNYYMRWLNDALVHGLWNLIFLFSNFALFVLIPFAYLFTESEGFSGSKKGIISRLYETIIMLFLFALLVFGLAWVATALFDGDKKSRKSFTSVWNYYLPFLYSCISILGVLMLLISAPLGFTRMFSVIGAIVVKPFFIEDVEEKLYAAQFEEDDVQRKLKVNHTNGNHTVNMNQEELQETLVKLTRKRKNLERRVQSSAWQRNLGYPLLWILLFILTIISLSMVCWNVFLMVFGLDTLPVNIREAGLGKVSFSKLGIFGSLLEVILILYLMLASVVGFYSVPWLHSLVPKHKETPMTKVIVNCIVLLILSSALPVVSRSLGITNFDLLGAFGEFDWLDNFYFIIVYNGLFAIGTSLCLVNRFTASVRSYIFQKVLQYMYKVRKSRATSWIPKPPKLLMSNGRLPHIAKGE